LSSFAQADGLISLNLFIQSSASRMMVTRSNRGAAQIRYVTLSVRPLRRKKSMQIIDFPQGHVRQAENYVANCNPDLEAAPSFMISEKP